MLRCAARGALCHRTNPGRNEFALSQTTKLEELRSEARRLAGNIDSVGIVESCFGFVPDAKQCEVLRCGSSRLLLCCSRQWGKSSTAAALAAVRALTEPGSLVLCVSPTLRQSGEFLRKVSGFLQVAGEKFSGGRLAIYLPNGSRVVALPGQEANVRGFSAPSLIVIDEAARVEDSLYQAMRPMLVVGRGDLALISTPFGERGFFWKEWVAGGERWTRIEVKATECSRISAEVLEEERESQSAEWFAQEYLCSFVGMENQAFRTEWLEAARREGLGVTALAFELKGRVR